MALKEKLEKCLNEAVNHGEAAGLSVLVRKDGKDLCYAAAGKADIASGRPVERDSIFRLYSQSKPITAAAAMILADRGILDLQTGLDQYLPGFRNPRFAAPDGQIRKALRAPWVIELLGMTAGLCYPDADPAGQYAARVFEENQEAIRQGGGMDTVTFCNRLGEQPLAFAPGTGWRYSTCADVLGAVIETVSGKRFGSVIIHRHSRVFVRQDQFSEIQLPFQSAPFFNAQRIQRDMLHSQPEHSLNGPGPAFRRLAGIAVDQVQADIPQPGIPERLHRERGLLRRMPSAHTLQFLGDRGLHPEADTVDPASGQSGCIF